MSNDDNIAVNTAPKEISLADISRIFEKDSDEGSDNLNSFFYPQHKFRWLLVAPSGQGKTSVLLHALVAGKIKFTKLYLYARNLSEIKYVNLIKHYQKSVETMNKHLPEDEQLDIEDLLYVGDSEEDIKPLDELSPHERNLVVFDDFITDKHANNGIILEYFIRGRKSNCSLIYITQSYFSVPKDLRNNCSHYSIWKFNNNLAKNIIRDLGESKEVFEYYLQAVKEKYNFFHIDKNNSNPALLYRKNFNGIILIEPKE